MNPIYKIVISCFLFASLVSSAGGQVECSSLDIVVSRSSIIILGEVEQAVLTYLDQPQMYNVPAEFQYNVTVFEVSVVRLAKGFSVSPVYVIGEERDPNTTFIVGQQYVLFLSNLKDSCAPSPPYSPCTLPSTPSSATFYIQPEGKFRVSNHTVYYGYQAGGPCTPLPNGVPLDQFMARISYLSYNTALTITTALFLGLGSGALLYRRRMTSKRPSPTPVAEQR
ncbi:hypothetical protein AUI06_10810 [archaeon 13_2_20CM_2_52_21]|nr:MAG: hypothetical protein AUI06_10810 [archaeon 13_2_20CM_2_52_21]